MDMNNPENFTGHYLIMARTAKEKTDEVNKTLATNILIKVIPGINQSISRGKYYYEHNFIDVSETQLKHVEEALELRGYVVGPKPGDFPKTFLRISWYKPSR